MKKIAYFLFLNGKLRPISKKNLLKEFPQLSLFHLLEDGRMYRDLKALKLDIWPNDFKLSPCATLPKGTEDKNGTENPDNESNYEAIQRLIRQHHAQKEA